jgi:hypothetical protein
MAHGLVNPAIAPLADPFGASVPFANLCKSMQNSAMFFIQNAEESRNLLFSHLCITPRRMHSKKILWPSVGLQSGLIGTGWSSLALLGKKIRRQDLTEEVRAAESILQA